MSKNMIVKITGLWYTFWSVIAILISYIMYHKYEMSVRNRICRLATYY